MAVQAISMPCDFQNIFSQALSYREYLATHGSPEEQVRWKNIYETVCLTDAQQALLTGFRRKMNVLCLAGTWCGDCVNACPIFQHFAQATPAIELRFVHRPRQFDSTAGDPVAILAHELSICGGPRVPMLVFFSEDWYECERFGERTLATYRNMAASVQGPVCSTGLIAPPADLLSANVAEWLSHFERVQLMLRTSPRLLRLHGGI